MRKIYALMVLLFAVLQLPALVLVQGRPLPPAKPLMESPSAIADGTFTMDMIVNWSGEGAYRAAFVVQWNAESETSALVWGFRWDGEATGETMARAIAASDPRFFIMTETGTAYGSTVSGFGYDVNKSGDFSITKDGVTLSPDENGVIFSSSYGYDGWTCTDPEDYWQSGWYQGYWSYWLKSSDSDPWGYSGTGITGRKLTDGCWDGWNFSVNMSSRPWKPLAPAPKNGPTAPSVKVQPEDLTVSPGESVTFAPEFKGDSLYFQWYKDEVAIQDAEASSYSIVSAETSDAGRYYCVVSNMLDTISTDTVTLVVGDKSVIAAPGEEPGTALVVYDDSYASFSGILTIPQTILIEGESYTVVGIDDMAFMGCAKLTSVTFPSTLKTIGEGVFYGCSRLTSVELPAQTVSIGNEAFGDCPLLATLSLGEGLKSIGNLDYVSCWYKKAADYMGNYNIRAALVSTNSITQGESVSILWKPLFESGVHIDFAYRTFIWDSEASIKAHVHCVIVGFSRAVNNKQKIIYSGENAIPANNINGYLLDAENIFIEKRMKPLCNVPEIALGGQAIDGGFLILTEEEKEEFLEKEPQASPFFRHYMMGKDFIDRKPRYCIWLVGADPGLLKKCPMILERVNKVREFRLSSTRANTKKAAENPTLFASILEHKNQYIAIPKVSSQNRRYIPMDYLDGEIIPGDKLFTMPNASFYEFGVLMSNVHMAWMRAVCGRLKSDYSYSNTIVYNNFPWPVVTEKNREQIEKSAQEILKARTLYPNSNLAALYDPLTMPAELRRAHTANDKAVMAAYGFSTKMTEADCVGELMKLYQKMQ